MKTGSKTGLYSKISSTFRRKPVSDHRKPASKPVLFQKILENLTSAKCRRNIVPTLDRAIHTLSGELLTAEEEGGKTSSQYFIKYLSRLIMLKMYRKCTAAPFTPFLMIEKLKPCLA